MGFLTGMALIAGLHVLAGISAHLTHGRAYLRAMPALITFLALPVPSFLPAYPAGLRFLAALGAAMGFLRAIDLARDRTPRSLLFRIQHLVTAFDTRRITRATPRLHTKKALLAVTFGLVTVPAWFALSAVVPTVSGVLGLLLRWGVGLVFSYAITDLAYGAVAVSLPAVGFHVYELHRAPFLSRTVKEFWGERWNRTVSAWFGEHLLRPLARRRQAKLGVLASFLASATLHGYLVFSAIGGAMTLVMFSYFAVQGALVFLEMKVKAQTWSRPVGHAWTVTVMTVTSPLFVEPALQCLNL
jgi:hypothetical protein